jgi:hypothetical protein
MSFCLQRETEPIKHWTEEFQTRYRRPRMREKELARHLKESWPDEVILREFPTSTEIVLRLPFSSRQLRNKFKEVYSQVGFTLDDAFEEIVWKAPGAGQRSFWSQLARAGWSAYRQAWLHFLKVIYVDHFHPQANRKLLERLNKWLAYQPDLNKLASVGNRKETRAERASLLRRFKILEAWCDGLHQSINRYNRQCTQAKEIRSRVHAEIHGHRDDHLVLGGKAFGLIRTKNQPVLADAKSWKPRQLAIALLAFECGREYETVQKKIMRTLKSTR